jgi:hypothetical protein
LFELLSINMSFEEKKLFNLALSMYMCDAE